MATKLQKISELSLETSKRLSGYENWTAFLRSAAWQYKYTFEDQLLIYAQRPDARACADFDTWNENLHCRINRGAKGIALLREGAKGYYLDHVFDVSDTNRHINGMEIKLWQYDEKYDDALIETLENTFGELQDKTTITDAVMGAAHNAVEDNKADYLPELAYSKADSFLSDLDELNLDVEFQQTAEASIAYMIMARLGLSPEEVFERGDFVHIVDFNTPEALAVLGSAVGSISEQALREISGTIRAEIKKEQSKFFAQSQKPEYNRDNDEIQTENQAERTDTDDGNHIPDGERDTDTEPGSAGEQPAAVRSLRTDAEVVSQAAQAEPVRGDDDTGDAAGAPGGDRPDGEGTGREDGVGDGEGGGRGREAESREPAGVDRVDEQPQTFRRRGSPQTAHSQLSLFDLIDESNIAGDMAHEAERLNSRPAFSMPQQVVDEVLCDGTNDDESVLKICVEFSKDKPLAEKAVFLEQLYGTDGKGFLLSGGKVSAWWNEDGIKIAYGETVHTLTAELISWESAAKRIDALLDLGRYAPRETLLQMRDYEYKKAAEAFWYMHSDLNYDDYPDLSGLFNEEWFDGGFPDSTARIAGILKTPEGLEELSGVASSLAEQYATEDIMRWKMYSPIKVHGILADLQLERKSFAANELTRTHPDRFITSDEIDQQLVSHSSYTGKKYRISEFFKEHTDSKERVGFLKSEYGTGGGTNYWYDGKGMTLSAGSISAPFAKTVVTWNHVAKRIERLIQEGNYLSEKERSEDVPKYLAEQEQRRIRNEKIKFVDDANSLSDAEKLALLPERLSLFAKTMEPYEQKLIREYGLDGLIDGTEFDVAAMLRDTATRQRLSECMHKVGGAATGVYERNNGHQLSEEIGALHAVILHRVGGFYEMYGEEAVKAAEILQITVTPKTVDGKAVQMAGIPDFRAEDAAKMLTDNGYWVSLTEEPQAEPGISAMTAEDKQGHIDAIETALDYGEDVSDEDMEIYNRLIDERAEEENQVVPPLETQAEPSARFSVIETDEGYAVWDDVQEGIYVDAEGVSEEFTSEWQASAYCEELNRGGAQIESPEADEKAEQEPEPGLIGKEVTADGRKFIVDSINEASGSVSLKDITFENGTGFPIFRSESMEWLKTILQEQDVQPQPEQITPAFEKPKPSRVANTVIYPEISTLERNNFTITNDELGYGGAKEKFRNNMAAIDLLHELELEKRLAMPDEQEILSNYVGWGGLADAFDETKDQWASEFQELYTALSPEEYEQARASTLTAHFTPPVVIKAMYRALENMGFSQGNILEPSCGIGNFMGLMPDSMRESKLYGIELDSITGRIAQQLYQKNSVAIQGFEDTMLPDSFFDVAIGNVPFGDFKVLDKKYNKHNFLIHDYFFAKTLDKVRPGGVVAFITSSGTMDKQNSKVRRYIAQRADLIGAIRLPNTAFRKNAGTEVTADILFLQKRDKMTDIMPDWVHLGQLENGHAVNQYFIDNPDMVMGELTEVSGPFGPVLTCAPDETTTLADQLDAAIQNIHATITEYEYEDISNDEDMAIPADPNVRNFSYTVVDGSIYFRENSMMRRVELNETAQNRIKGMIDIRDCVRTLIEYQTEGYSDSEIKAQQAKLNTLYDDFTKKYGLINSRGNSLAFAEDSSYFLLCSLEILDENNALERKADMFTKRTIGAKKEVTRVDTASEALAVSLGEKAKVDMELMMSLTGKTEEELVDDLKNVIFLNPQYIEGNDFYDKYLTTDEYLSGNVRQKLRTAQLIAETDDSYIVNVEALTAVQPKDLSASEITVRLGSTWIPPEYIKQFAVELLSPSSWAQSQMDVIYFTMTGTWNVTGKNADKGVKALNTYGTKRINAYKIIEETLNLKDVRIFDYVENENGNRVAVLNRKETTIAQQKQDAIKTAFDNWIWKDPQRRETLTKLYNEKFNSNRPREYDGSHVTFNGMNPEIALRKHQKDAVARIMYGGNSLLGHVVGAGKTWTMAAAAIEMKHLGLCNKSLFVVPNHLTEQWAAEFLQLYPSANILVATKKDFEMKNRKKFCGRIATGDYDAVIIGHSQFEKIPISMERQRIILERQRDEIIDGIIEAKAEKAERFTVKQMEKTKRALEAKLDKLNDQSRKDDVVTFEELGVDRVFVDEAHSYKNLFIFTKMRNVGGISQTEAQKSSDLFMKSQYLDEITGGKGLIFATGTPISNSMVEMYTMQRYLQYHTLVKNDLHHFDAWASTFGETVTAIELAPEGTGYRAKTRFAKFFNLPELMAMFKEVADIQTADMLNLPVPEAEYHTIAVEPTEFQKEMVAGLAERAEEVRGGTVDPTVDNMLRITNDGRKLALDQRMINPMLPDDEQSKVSACINNVFDVWQKTAEKRATQLVFCDLSTPKSDGTFSVYNSVREKLLAKGVPENEIAFIHDADSEVKKKELFSKVRKGDVRILLGSTPKMGAGTNVQRLLYASHDLDCPWVRLEVA